MIDPTGPCGLSGREPSSVDRGRVDIGNIDPTEDAAMRRLVIAAL
jgi:hypothetical protein